MKRRFYFLCLFGCLLAASGWPQKKMTANEYITKYSPLAIESMEEFGIPASIKMAQALVESQNGNSRLAQEANNHFGIKCKSDWQGATIKHDDDAPDECFRRYQDVYDSYADHSYFLSNSDRYRSLFELDPTDYTGWANGLAQAGYATNPNYADMLINTIETYKLYELDRKVVQNELPQPQTTTVTTTVTTTTTETHSHSAVDPSYEYVGPRILDNEYAVLRQGRMPIYVNNNTRFVIAEEGDTFDSIAQRMRIGLYKLLSFNDMVNNPQQIRAGSIVYISPKKKKSLNGIVSHLVSKGETLHFVSQKYGIRLDRLARMNYMDVGYQIKPGQRIRLR